MGIACSPQYSGKQPPKVINGEIDLTGWDFEEDGPVKLDGDWLFAWKKFVEPASWQSIKEQMTDTVRLPRAWPDLDEPENPDKKLSGTGYASYAIKLKLAQTSDLGIIYSDYYSPNRLRLLSDSGESIAEVLQGIPSIYPINEIPVGFKSNLLRLDNLPFTAEKPNPYTLLMHISSHLHSLGGPGYSLTLGSLDSMQSSHKQEVQMKVLTFGILLVVALFHVILYMQRPEDKTAIYFALLSGVFALRSFILGVAQNIDWFFSKLGFITLVRLDYAHLALLPVIASYFLGSLVKATYFKRLSLYALCIAFIYVLLALFSPTTFFTKYLLEYQYFILTVICLAFSGLAFYALQKNNLAILILLFSIIPILGTFNDILHAHGIIKTEYIVQYTFIIFILLQAGLISFNNARAHKQAQTLAIDLHNEIKEKKELQVSNEELADQKKKTSDMLRDVTREFTAMSQQLDNTREEQKQVAKELQEASRQLIQAEKLSGLGAMVSGIAHDINNPLNFIETARFQEQEKLDQLKEHLLGLVPEGEEGEEFKADLLARFERLGKLNEQIKTGVTRVTEISKSMRNASRADTEKTNDVNLVEIIEESVIITGNKVKQFELIKKTPDGIALATCNRSQIGQVVMNLLSNAADALVEFKGDHKDHKGVIQIALSISNQKKKQSNQKIIKISVSDNGAGVPQENRDKVLNAFYTTKAAGVGTGLGLAICGKVAQAHDGIIYIEDGLDNGKGGYGARFTLEFVG